MNKERANKLMDTKCPNDYKNRHRWTRAGISLTGYNCALEEIWQCSQCNQIIRIELNELKE